MLEGYSEKLMGRRGRDVLRGSRFDWILVFLDGSVTPNFFEEFRGGKPRVNEAQNLMQRGLVYGV